MPGPAAPNDIRLRKPLDGNDAPTSLPTGFHMRNLEPGDEQGLHALLTEVFDDGSDWPFEAWWPRLRADPEFDPALCFLIFDEDGSLAAAALAWNSAFLKDLAVRDEFRRRGLGDFLLRHMFAVFRERGATHLDLKTNTVLNADALRLYQRHGMIEVDWEG